MKEQYLEIMEAALNAYSDAHIQNYFAQVQREGLQEHGFPRLTANMGILIAHGKRTELLPLFLEMMDFCCRQIPLVPKGRAGHDFTIKEILFAIREVRDAGVVPMRKIESWKAELATFDPYYGYSEIAPSPDTRVGNWAAYNAASEWLRHVEGLCNPDDFLNLQIPSQLLSFDENGMYRDPKEPMLYDLATRCQMMVLLYFGYRGKYWQEIDELLRKGGLLTLQMQSVTGEIPFGGRSNQFLFNEAYLAAICEFEAARYAKAGNQELAGQLKRAAHLAVNAIKPWLKLGEEKHIKNHYPKDSFYGCEGYGYFDKYMISLASFTYLAYLFADDTILESESCPAEAGGYLIETSNYFHKLFCNRDGYFLEYDWAADPHYDGSGLGRIHKTGAPPAICLSVPFAKTPSYEIDHENPGQLSICCGVATGKGWMLSADSETVHTLIGKCQTEKRTAFTFRVVLQDGTELEQTCSIDRQGVELRVMGEGDVCLMLPVFTFDGAAETDIVILEKSATTTYQGWQCRYRTDGVLTDTGLIYCNRNGHYRAIRAMGKGNVTVRLQIEKVC